MKRSKRFAPIQRIASMRENQAAKTWGEARRTEAAARDQLQALAQYLNEYREIYHRARQRGMGAGQMIEYQRFIAKLEAAIREQQATVGQCEDNSRRQQTQWEQRHSGRSALDKVAGRIQAEELQSEEKAEQKAMDDRPWRGGRGK